MLTIHTRVFPGYLRKVCEGFLRGKSCRLGFFLIFFFKHQYTAMKNLFHLSVDFIETLAIKQLPYFFVNYLNLLVMHDKNVSKVNILTYLAMNVCRSSAVRPRISCWASTWKQGTGHLPLFWRHSFSINFTCKGKICSYFHMKNKIKCCLLPRLGILKFGQKRFFKCLARIQENCEVIFSIGCPLLPPSIETR